MKKITIYDFLTEEEVQRCVQMWRADHSVGYANRVAAEVILPNMARINAALGQENDPQYLGYAVEYVMSEASKQ